MLTPPPSIDSPPYIDYHFCKNGGFLPENLDPPSYMIFQKNPAPINKEGFTL